MRHFRLYVSQLSLKQGLEKEVIVLARRWSAYAPALRTWWFTSRFLTYQSPLRLLALFERYDQQADCHNGAALLSAIGWG